jgi:transcription elongation GreA/GreB family factor
MARSAHDVETDEIVPNLGTAEAPSPLADALFGRARGSTG